MHARILIFDRTARCMEHDHTAQSIDDYIEGVYTDNCMAKFKANHFIGIRRYLTETSLHGVHISPHFFRHRECMQHVSQLRKHGGQLAAQGARHTLEY